MSWQPAATATCTDAKNCSPVDLIIRPDEHDLGAFSVRRALPAPEQQMVGPFIFFDQMGPATLGKDQPVNVRPHPHIGLATLTWLFEGRIMHRDSLGYAQEIVPGEVNWMTAGSGIVHSERTPDHLLGKANSLFGLQVWMALPKEHEETTPTFQHYTADEIPLITGDGLRAAVVAGSAWGATSPVDVYSDTLYVDLEIEAGKKAKIDKRHEERATYILSGEVDIAGATFGPGEMLILKPDLDIDIAANTPAHLVLIGGARMDGPRFKYWNFVSSSEDRIEQAKSDWREGRFPTVPGDDQEFIPLPD